MKNNRTFLEKLLDRAEVEWKPLGKVTDIKTGQSVSKNIIAQNPGIYPVINSGRDPLGFINVWNTENDPIGITTRGAGVGSITWQEGKYFRGNLNYSVTIKSEYELNVRFLYHILLHFQKEIHNLCSFTGIPALNASELKKLEIPIPPLSVQTEIVKILDALTALTSELTSELILRQKQYEYYREKLLSEEELEKVGFEWKYLTQVADLTRGRVISKEYLSDNVGDYPVYSSQTVDNGEIGKIDSFDFDGEFVSWTTDGANAGTVFYRSGKFSITNVCGLIKIKNNPELNYKFLFYWLSIEAKKHVYSGMGNPKLMSHQMEKIKIPIPPLSIQTKIVKILDKFESLTNSITEGLPLAIEQSQKRYEYYRELLLNFHNP